MATAKKATKKTRTKTKTKAPLEVCIDRPVTLLNAAQRMLHSIQHNPANNPAQRGTREHELVTRFIKDPHHSFTADEAGILAQMALITASEWQRGTTLTISFLDGSATQKKMVKKMAAKWLPFIDLKFHYPASAKGMIRISFVHDPGSWSYIGTECLSIPVNEPTMNFGWLRDDTDDAEWERVVVHEFGHALGCIHEHQSPAGGIKWNKPAVYKYYEGPPNNWTKAEVDSNIFQKYSKTRTQFTALDPNSIMMYPIPKEFLLSGNPVGWNLHLSPTDETFIAEIYPKTGMPKKSKATVARSLATPAAVGAANLNVRFTNGLGQLDAQQFRYGAQIAQGSVSSSGTIPFSNVQSGDFISINGTCAGSAAVSIDVATHPATPQSFSQEPINMLFVVQ